jgi:hypothetical protein
MITLSVPSTPRSMCTARNTTSTKLYFSQEKTKGSPGRSSKPSRLTLIFSAPSGNAASFSSRAATDCATLASRMWGMLSVSARTRPPCAVMLARSCSTAVLVWKLSLQSTYVTRTWLYDSAYVDTLKLITSPTFDSSNTGKSPGS